MRSYPHTASRNLRLVFDHQQNHLVNVINITIIFLLKKQRYDAPSDSRSSSSVEWPSQARTLMSKNW